MDGRHPRAWVMTIARRKAIDHHRARARRPEPREDVPEVAAPRRDGRARRPRRRGLVGGRRALARPSARRWRCATRATSPTARSPRRWRCSEEAARRRVADGLRALREHDRPRGGGAMSTDARQHQGDPRRRTPTSSPRGPPRGWSSAPTAEGLVDVAYASFDSPLGTGQRGRDRSAGSSRSGCPGPDGRRVPRASSRARSRRGCWSCRGRLDAARRELDEYFDGERREFDLDARLAAGALAVSQPRPARDRARPLRGHRDLRRGRGAGRQPARLPRRRARRSATTRSRSSSPATASCGRGGAARRLRRRAGDEGVPASPRGRDRVGT